MRPVRLVVRTHGFHPCNRSSILLRATNYIKKLYIKFRTRDESLFEKGKKIVNDYIANNPTWEGCQLFINDPMTVGIYPQDSKGATFNEIVLKLESLGFYGKAAGYAEVK
jgi:hypothetical protein